MPSSADPPHPRQPRLALPRVETPSLDPPSLQRQARPGSGGRETSPRRLHLTRLQLPARETIGGHGRRCGVRGAGSARRPPPFASRGGGRECPQQGKEAGGGRVRGEGSPPAGRRAPPGPADGCAPPPHTKRPRPGEAAVGSAADQQERRRGQGLTMKSRAKLSSPLRSGLFMAWTRWMNFLRISTCSILPRPPGCGRCLSRRRHPPARRRARSVFPSSFLQPRPPPSRPPPTPLLPLPPPAPWAAAAAAPARLPTPQLPGAAAALPQ